MGDAGAQHTTHTHARHLDITCIPRARCSPRSSTLNITLALALALTLTLTLTLTLQLEERYANPNPNPNTAAQGAVR
eukprot:scaffold103993_cov69-Phaeocystis_antarctica.AAC.1